MLRFRILTCLSIMLVLVFGVVKQSVAQDSSGNCVRLAGVESSGEKLSFDPINQPSREWGKIKR